MINYLIVDDEPIAHEIIEEYAENLKMLKLRKNCYNVFEALEYLNKHAVDIIFLDINMPKVNGFEFLKSLSNPPKIIVTTAHKEYALEGYELDIIDYLLKPFSLNRFLKAVQKAIADTSSNIKTTSATENNTIFLKDGKTHHQVAIKKILYIEALGNYTKVYTADQVIVTLEKLSSYLDKLADVGFLQIHKSYVVPIDKVEKIQNNKIVIGDATLPIGQTYKHNITSLLNR